MANPTLTSSVWKLEKLHQLHQCWDHVLIPPSQPHHRLYLSVVAGMMTTICHLVKYTTYSQLRKLHMPLCPAQSLNVPLSSLKI